MHIREMQRAAWENSERHGFHDPTDTFGDKIALIHSEASEALEAFRDTAKDEPLNVNDYGDNGKPEGVPAELADVVIRVMDLAESLHIDLEAAILEKHAYNVGRPFKHGGKRI
jgi:NTP pyrophosphatase (non-canonical NTP hydrolase)